MGRKNAAADAHHRFGAVLDREQAGSTTALLTFFALAFAWSWACWLLSPLLAAESPTAAAVIFMIGGFGPSLAALAVVAHRGGRSVLRAWLKHCLQWRVGWRWMVLAFLFPVVFMGLAAAAHVALGGQRVGASDSRRSSATT